MKPLLEKNYLILILLVLLAGCELSSFISVKKSNEAPRNAEAITSSVSKIKIDSKENRAAYFNYLDNSEVLRTIDLDIEAKAIETVAYSDNIWVFSAVKYLTESEVANYPDVEYESSQKYAVKDFYYIKLNDSNPTKVKFSDSTELPCRESLIETSLVIQDGFIYCANQNLRLLKTDLSDFSQQTIYSNIIFRSEDDRETDRITFEVIEIGAKKFYVLKSTTEKRFAQEASLFLDNGSTATEISGVGQINTLNKESYQVVSNNLITISNDGIATVVRNNNTVAKIVLTEIQKLSGGYAYYIDHTLFINSDAYFAVCNERTDRPDGIYRYDFSSPEAPMMTHYSMGDIDCMNIQGMYSHAGKIYIRTFKKGKNDFELYRFDKDSVGSELEKVINLSGAALVDGHGSLYPDNALLDPILKTENHLCFSGEDNGRYFPYCIDSSHQLNKVANSFFSDRLDNQQVFKAANNRIYFLTKNPDVKVNRFTPGSYTASEVSATGTMFNKGHLWHDVVGKLNEDYHLFNNDEDVYQSSSRRISRQYRMIAGKNSYLGFITYSSANLKVEIKDNKTTVTHDFSNTAWTNVLPVRKYESNHYFMVHDESNAELYVLNRNNKKSLNIKMFVNNYGAVVNANFLYVLSRDFRLYEINMKTDTVKVIDTDVVSYNKNKDGVIYLKNIPFEIFTYSQAAGKSSVSYSFDPNDFDFFGFWNPVEIGSSLFFQVRNKNFEYIELILRNGNIDIVRASDNTPLNGVNVYSSDLKNNLAVVGDLNEGRYVVYNLSNGQRQEYPNNYYDIWSFHEKHKKTNIFPSDLVVVGNEARLSALENKLSGISTQEYTIPNYLNNPTFENDFSTNGELYFIDNNVYYLLFESQFKGSLYKLVASDVPVKILDFDSQSDLATLDPDLLMAFYPSDSGKSSHLFSLENKTYFSYPILQNGKLASFVYEIKENAQNLDQPMLYSDSENHVQLNLNVCSPDSCNIKFEYQGNEGSWVYENMFKQTEYYLFEKEKTYPMFLNSNANNSFYKMMESLNSTEEIFKLNYLFVLPN